MDDNLLGGDAVMLFSMVNVDVVDQLGHHALGDGDCVGVVNRSQRKKYRYLFRRSGVGLYGVMEWDITLTI